MLEAYSFAMDTPKDSEGCMLINDYVVDKFDDIVFEDKQENKNKEQRLKDSLIKDFTKEILGKRRWRLVELCTKM